MSRISKISLAPSPWVGEEERVWGYLLRNKLASAREVAMNCDVTEEIAQSYIDRIGTPREVFEKEALIMKALSENVDDEGFVTFVSSRGEEPSTKDKQVGGSHYKDMSIQPWEAMEAWLTPEEYRGYHKGVAIGYLARERQKGGDQDVAKAVHHLQRLLEYLDGK